MIDLDDPVSYRDADPSRVGDAVRAIPGRCRQAWAAGRALALPDRYRRARRVVIAGSGHGAAAGALAHSLYARSLPLPIQVWRDYGLPASAAGPETLVVAASATGESDIALSALDAAAERGCCALILAPGGSPAPGIPALQPPTPGPAHLAGLELLHSLMGLLAQLNLIPDAAADAEEAADVLETESRALAPDLPAARNPAKRLAGQFVDRLGILVGAGALAPVAGYWKLQLNHLAKTLAVCEEMPEANHGAVLGYDRPADIWQKTLLLQLRGDCDGPRLSARYDVTTVVMLEAGLNQDTVRARGRSLLAQQCSLAYLGDWVAYYAAVMSGTDPAYVQPIERLPESL